MNADLQNLSDQMDALRQKFDAAVATHEKAILLEHRLLDACLNNQVAIQYDFELLKAKASGLLKEAEAYRDQLHSYAFTVEMRSNAKPGAMEARKYADCNSGYIEAVKVYNKGFKLEAEIDAVVEVLVSRKFVLSNLTNAVVNSVNKHIL